MSNTSKISNFNYAKIKEVFQLIGMVGALILFIAFCINTFSLVLKQNEVSSILLNDVSKWTYAADIPEDRAMMRELITCYNKKVYTSYENKQNYEQSFLILTSIKSSNVMTMARDLKASCLNEMADRAAYEQAVKQDGTKSISDFTRRLGYKGSVNY